MKKWKRIGRFCVGVAALGVMACQLLLGVVSCSSIECPIENKVQLLCSVDGTLEDTLTVTTMRKNGTDTILLNRKEVPTAFALPISYQHDIDKLVFTTTRLAVSDTVWIEKEDQPHFESVSCGVKFFHRLLSVRSTHFGIDSVVITKSYVDYDSSTTHLLFYFKARP